jgi:hypothetical protein
VARDWWQSLVLSIAAEGGKAGRLVDEHDVAKYHCHRCGKTFDA